jgi:ParB-like chromosome segregation protein Spo0J
MEFHEYANIYRLLPDSDLQKMADDIREKGQLLPITSYEGKILDGRNRYKACQLADVEPRIEEYTGNDPLGLIASLNDHRRHDSENERAIVAARMANLKNGQRPVPTGLGGDSACTIERAAELTGATPRSIKRAKNVIKTGIPEVVEAVENNEISMRAAEEIAKLPPEEQKAEVEAKKSNKPAKKKKTTLPRTPKPKKNALPTRDEVEANHRRILGLLKSTWVSAPSAIREEFLAWVEKTKNSTHA